MNLRMKMTTKELAELFLAHLYDLAEAAPHPHFLFPVNDFAPKLDITNREELQKAIDLLSDRGFIFLASFDRLGGISAGITIEGSVFVEKGGETGVIEQHRKASHTDVNASSEPSSQTLGHEGNETVNEDKQKQFFPDRSVEAILADIEDVLEEDHTIALETKKDLLSDLATLKIQMKRNVKNKQIIDAVLRNLSGIPSITPLLTGLNRLVETYFR
jgi:hypothetical protein